jgi:two-component SAPR family response regulator
MKPRIVIRLFGRFSFHCGNHELLRHTSAKAKEIFCYVAAHRHGPVPRDRIAAILSTELDPERSAKALRHALWQLKADLCPDGEPGPWRVMQVHEGWIQFAMDESVSLDIAEFETASKDPARHAQAVGVYSDEFLHGWDQEWCMEERERLRQIYLGTLDSLTGSCESGRDIKAGIAYAMLALRNDPTRECTHRALMRLYYGSGDRKSALQQYERCLESLRAGLDVEPDDETKTLERIIRAGHAVPNPVIRSGSVRRAAERISVVPRSAQAPGGPDARRK